jgi:RNA polymerase sigma-70 factor (ECF subfamily)
MASEYLHNEQELIFLISKGDENAFAKIFDIYKDRVYSVAIRLTHSTTVSEEIVEDVFLKIWIRRATLNEIENFNAYLFTIARNETYKILKQISRNYKLVSIENNQLLTFNNSEDRLIEKEYTSLLNEAVRRLPSQQKQVYKLIKEGDLKRDQVALELNIQPETVKYHLAQAMKNIRAFCLLHLGTFTGVTIVFFRLWKK